MTARVPAAAVATGFLSFVVMGAVQAMYGPSLPGFGETFRVDAATAGLALSVHAIGAMAGNLGAAPLEHLGLGRWRTGLAVAALGVGALLVGVAPGFAALLVGVALAGVGYGLLTVGLNGLFAVGFGPRSPAMLNLLNAVFGIGSAVGPLLVALLGGANIRLPFLAVALAAALLAPFALRLDDRVPPPPPGDVPRGATGLLVGFVLVLALGVGVEASSIGWGATYLVSLGAAPSVAATVTSLFFVAFTAGRALAAPLSLRVAPPALVGGALVAACLLLLLARLPGAAPAAIALLGLTLAPMFPGLFLWLNRALPHARRLNGVVLAGALIGAAVFPGLIGRAVDAWGANVIPTLLLGCTLATLAVLAGLWRAQPRGERAMSATD